MPSESMLDSAIDVDVAPATRRPQVPRGVVGGGGQGHPKIRVRQRAGVDSNHRPTDRKSSTGRTASCCPVLPGAAPAGASDARSWNASTCRYRFALICPADGAMGPLLASTRCGLVARNRRRACTVAVHGPGTLRTVGPTGTAPIAPSSGSSADSSRRTSTQWHGPAAERSFSWAGM